MHLQVTHELEFHSFAPFEAAMAEIVPAATAAGWTLHAALKHLTGNICLVTQLWEHDDDGAGLGELGLAGAHAALRPITRGETVQRLTPLPYHPAARLGAAADGAVYQRVAFHLEPGNDEQFLASMALIVPALSGTGWELAAALRREAGSLDYAYNLWRLPALADMTTAGPKARAANPDLPSAVAPLTRILVSETIDLMAPLAHHPG
jgi:hypothetical protein